MYRVVRPEPSIKRVRPTSLLAWSRLRRAVTSQLGTQGRHVFPFRGEGGIRLFAFPRNAERRKLWAMKIKQNHWLPTNTSRLCEVRLSSVCLHHHRRRRRQGKVPTQGVPVSRTLRHWYRTVSTSSKHFFYSRPYRRKAQYYSQLLLKRITDFMVIHKNTPPSSHYTLVQ